MFRKFEENFKSIQNQTTMEIWETTITALASFIVAFYAEPIKIYFSNKARKRQFKNALYREILQIHSQLSDIRAFVVQKRMDESGFIFALNRITCQAYQTAKADPFLLYELKEAIDFDVLYKNLELLQQLALKSMSFEQEQPPNQNLLFNLMAYLDAALISFKAKVSNGSLEVKAIEKLATPVQKQFLEQLTKAG